MTMNDGTTLLEYIEANLLDEAGEDNCKELNTLREPLLRLRTDKYVELTQAREKCRHPKDKELTDWDRRVMNDAMVAELQAEYDYLLGLEELVKERINFKWL